MVNSCYKLKTLSLYFCFLFHVPTTVSISFEITRFDSNDTSIVYEGGAAPNPEGKVEFNDVNFMCQTGQIIYSEKVPMWDSRTQKLTDFTTQFSFYFDIQGRNQWGSGLAFFLAPVEFHLPLNSAGGFLGLYNTTNSDSAQNKIVHVEFDTYWNREWDPNFLHVGINNNSIQSSAYTFWDAKNHTGDPTNVLITYDSKTKNLSVSWEYQTTSSPGENTSLSLIIDLMHSLPEWVVIGFSASTSNRIERHVLESWKFNSTLVIHEKKNKNPKKMKLVLGVLVSVGGLILAAGAYFILKRLRKKRTETINLKSINMEIEKGAGPRKFFYKDLLLATGSFSENNKLGQGGFGAVYKGYLKHLGPIAVKKMSRDEKQGEKDYMDELRLISQVRHRNLVQLLGWCHDRGEFLLVYEFMPNGSLDAHLFDKKIRLTWAARYRIANDLASALLYLHEGWEKCVLHRDIKPSNIMLDKNVNAKLGDFGLARPMEHELGSETVLFAGTPGYVAPECVKLGKVSKSSDVYSFGLVALEIATGRRTTVPLEEYMSLVKWVWDLYGNGKLRMAVDEILGMDFEVKEAECLMVVGLWCAHPNYNLRPSIRQVINVLEFEAALPNLPREMPDGHVSDALQCAFTCGNAVISTTKVEGR